MKSPVRFTLLTLALVVLAFAVGVWLGGQPDRIPAGLRQTIVGEDASGVRSELDSIIRRRYFEEVDQDKVDQGSLRGMVQGLGDDFSHYYSPDEANSLTESIEGNFEGVGMSIEKDRLGLRVLNVFEGSPAERAGIKQGDVVAEVDRESIAGDTAEAASAKIKGPAGTKVRLRIVDSRNGRDRELEIERARVDVPAVASEIEDADGRKVGVIRLAAFSRGVHGQLVTEVDRLADEGVEGYVLDLRGNGGGLIDEAQLVASVFIEDGEIVSTRGRSEPERVYEATGDPTDTETPIVVLVDRGTASAAEIVAGALRDRGRAVAVVGEETFGKGVFQEVIPISNGGVLNLVVGSYFLPDGENLADDGIDPDVKAVDKLKTKRDEALPVALDELAGAL